MNYTEMRRKNQQIVELNEIKKILESNVVMNIGLYDASTNCPYIVPLNYGFEIFNDESIVFYAHCAKSGRKIDLINQNNNVCVSISKMFDLKKDDVPCNWQTNYDSFTGFGIAEILVDENEEKKYGMDLLMKNHGCEENFVYKKEEFSAMAILKITITNYTAKKYRAKDFENQLYNKN